MSRDDEGSVDVESTAGVTRRGTNEPAPRRSARYADAAEAWIDDLKEVLAHERERLVSVESRATEERREADQQRSRREEAERDLYVLRRAHRKLRFSSAFLPVCMATGSGLISSDPASPIWFGLGWSLVVVAGTFKCSRVPSTSDAAAPVSRAKRQRHHREAVSADEPVLCPIRRVSSGRFRTFS